MRVSTFTFVAVLAAVSGSAIASPVINGAIVTERLYNDSPGSSLTVTNAYPATVQYAETGVTTGVNRHNFRLSADAGASYASFQNGDSFSFFSDVTITGPGQAEAGLNVAPWWTPPYGGNFLVKRNADNTPGEVVVFDGRLPFYSFGNIYVPGTTARLGIIYEPSGLSMAAPGVVRYLYNDGVNNLSSPWLEFSEGNLFEGVVLGYGNWGTLNQASLGGYFQHSGDSTATFGNIVYLPAPGAASLLALGGLVATRRRR